MSAPRHSFSRRPRRAVLLSSPQEPMLAEAIRANAPRRLALEEVVPLPEDPRVTTALVQVLCRPRPVSVLFVAGRADQLGVEALAQCERLGMRVLAMESAGSAWTRRARPVSVARLPWFVAPRLRPAWRTRVAKRALDVTLAAAALAVLAVPLAAAALAIRVASGGPALHAFERVGRDGRAFRQLALRAEGRLGGRLRRRGLDRAPALWNVLRGDLSLVGPRPECPATARRLGLAVPGYEVRHLVRPGLAGTAELAGRHPAHRALAADLWYVAHASLRTDLRVLARAARRIARPPDLETWGTVSVAPRPPLSEAPRGDRSGRVWTPPLAAAASSPSHR